MSPAFSFYGDLSATLYQSWGVFFNDWSAWFWRKLPLTFERSDVLYDQRRLTQHYLMQSKESFTSEEVFCLWSPFDEQDAKNRLNNLRSIAGLPAWAFTDGRIPYSDRQLYEHSARVSNYNTVLVWKFSHPLLKEDGYHYTNQDPPQT